MNPLDNTSPMPQDTPEPIHLDEGIEEPEQDEDEPSCDWCGESMDDCVCDEEDDYEDEDEDEDEEDEESED